MKKMIALLITVFMLTATVFSGMALAAENEDLTGEWHIIRAKKGSAEMDASIIKLMGMDMILTLNEDGTASMDNMGTFQEGTWKADGEGGILTFENEVRFTFTDGNIVVEQDDGTLTFSKEAASGSAVTLAPAASDVKPDDFNGSWNGTVYVLLGMPLPLEAVGVNISLDIEEGKVSVYESVKKIEDENETVDSIEKEFSTEMKEDGTLYIDFGGDNILEQIGMEAAGIILTLHEDGKMSGTTPELIELMESMKESSAEEENTSAEAADDADTDSAEPGTSEGSSAGDSSEGSMDTYLLFEKAE